MNELMTVSGVARALCRSQEGIRLLADKGKLRCQRTSTGQRLFLASDVQKFIADGKNGGRPNKFDQGDFGKASPLHPYRKVVVDIETAALPEVSALLDDPKPPKNYRDPEKIAAWTAEAREKRRAGSALDPDLCRIVAIGAWPQGGNATSMIAEDEEEEAVMLKSFWASVTNDDRLVGFNIMGFDLPVLLRRSLYLLGPRFNLPRFQLRKYGATANVSDLMVALSFDGILPYKSLKFYARRFGLDNTDEVSGAMIPKLAEAGNWSAIRGHVEADVKTTADLAIQMGILQEDWPNLKIAR